MLSCIKSNGFEVMALLEAFALSFLLLRKELNLM
jgi:hypothetical protein